MQALTPLPSGFTADTLSEKAVCVLLPIPHTSGFTYRVPEGMVVGAGDVVIVPFRGRSLTGIVWEKAEAAPGMKLKAIEARLDFPPFSHAFRKFLQWMAEYNITPLGSILTLVYTAGKRFAPLAKELCYQWNNATRESARRTQERQKVQALCADNLPRTKAALLEQTGVSPAVLNGLIKQEMLIPVEEVLTSKYANVAPFPAITLPPLSPMQQEAAEMLTATLGKGFSVALLEGVTGSGKTEVYFAAIKQLLETTSRQVMLLLPEIALTAQLVARVKDRFGFAPALWHSGVTDSQKREIWHGVAEGRERLIIGARSCLFLPFKALGLIIVDEEHEPAYKQEDGVPYHARDMAVMRAKMEEVPIFLASATPSLETIFNCSQGKYGHIKLPSRFGAAVMPKIDIVDMRGAQENKQSWISPRLREALALTVANGRQAIIFLNRRGYAPLTLCRKCGHRITCPSCSSWLVEHKRRGHYACHHCGYTQGLLKECPACHEEESFVACGPGVERVAEEISHFLPAARLAQMTKDTITTAKEAESMVEAILAHEVDIIIGTQMLAKGHHFPLLTLVGVVDADLGLSGGDLRAAERTYQLLHQVGGRAGREAEGGTVIIQTYNPENPVIEALRQTDTAQFIRQEMEGRKIGAMPPFSRLAAIILSGKNQEEVEAFAKYSARCAPQTDAISLLGPAPAPIFQLRERFRYRFLLRAERGSPLQRYINEWFSRITVPASIHIKIDVDPYNFF